MKNKLILGLGTTAAIVAPVVAVVSCGMGSVFKDKITSVSEAKRDVHKLFDELSKSGKLGNDVLKYTTYASLDSLNNAIEFKGASGLKLNKDDLVGMTFNVDDMKMTKDAKVWGFRDWSRMHNDYSGTLEVTLKDGTTKADASIFFKYAKTHSAYIGKHSMLSIAGTAIFNAAYTWKHEISRIKIIKK